MHANISRKEYGYFHELYISIGFRLRIQRYFPAGKQNSGQAMTAFHSSGGSGAEYRILEAYAA